MSRSEHGNARDRTDPRDRARKRQIKRLIVSERRHLDTDMPVVSSDAVPIAVADVRDPSALFPAIDDLRGVMARLPEGSLNGLARIELVLPTDDVDGTIAPGIRAQNVLGTYSPDDATIRLHAYMCEPGALDRRYVMPYVWLRALGTLVHEIGHHQDFIAKETRGRWRADDDELEPNAEARQDAWLATCVVPYLHDTYPDELAELARRQVTAFGTAIPIEILARGSIEMFATRDLFDMLAETPTIEQQRHVAFWLHYDDHFDLALAILDHALAAEPDDIEALTDRAHVLGHLGRHDEAAAIARVVLVREPANLASLHLLRRQAIDAHDWPAIVELSTRLLAIETKPGHRFISLDRRMRASIELGDGVAAQRDVDELRELAASPEELRERAQHLRDAGHLDWADRLDR